MAVIAGLNASLLLEALDRREQGMLTACVDELVEAGRHEVGRTISGEPDSRCE